MKNDKNSNLKIQLTNKILGLQKNKSSNLKTLIDMP
jgi:hypothetical protein